MVKWSKTEIDNRVAAMDNATLVRETVFAAAGDDYDGCFTSMGEYEFDALQQELEKRLKATGFIDETFNWNE